MVGDSVDGNRTDNCYLKDLSAAGVKERREGGGGGGREIMFHHRHSLHCTSYCNV